MSSGGGWKTREVREAEAALAAAVERGREAVVRAQQVSAQLRDTRLSDDDLRQIDRAARGKDAPPQLRALVERIDRGDLNWRQIVDGHAMHDPQVQAAMQANVAQLGRVYRKFEEGYTLEDVLESETAGGRGSNPDDGDDNAVVLKHDSW